LPEQFSFQEIRNIHVGFYVNSCCYDYNIRKRRKEEEENELAAA